jgi:mono/diheme cytochrome c family protein
MPAWGAEGGGALTTQQIDELISYLGSIQLTSDEAKAAAEELLRKDLGLEEGAFIDYTDPAVGEAIFNLGLSTGEAGGAYSCARCHTKGASIVQGSQQPENADLSEYAGFPAGSGAFGFSLTGGIVPRQFLTVDDLIEFLTKGSEFGVLYGQRGQGTGRMPGWGDNPNTEDEDQNDGMLTEGMLRAVAEYEASLSGAPDDAEAGTTTTAPATPTTTSQEP